jgi:hypothetical protein
MPLPRPLLALLALLLSPLLLLPLLLEKRGKNAGRFVLGVCCLCWPVGLLV